MSFSITNNGKELDKSLYILDKNDKMFYTEMDNLNLDFSSINGWTFSVGNNCTLYTGHFCTVNTGRNCLIFTYTDVVLQTDVYCEIYANRNLCTVKDTFKLIEIYKEK